MLLEKELVGIKDIRIRNSFLFDENKVDSFFRRLRLDRNGPSSNTNDMALAAMVSLSVLNERFIKK